MLVPAVFLLALFVLLHLYRTPREVLRRYLATFHARHGRAFQIGVAVLGAACFSAFVASLVHPGHAAGEAVISLVLGGLALAGLLDLRRFRSS